LFYLDNGIYTPLFGQCRIKFRQYYKCG
jgi:hypothetical protein